MHVAYLILAHKNPAQLGRLVRRLDAPGVAFFIHIDLRSPIDGFRQELVRIADAEIHWVDRVASEWGRFGLVRAALNALEQALAYSPRIDRFVLLSGQDYPLRTARGLLDDWRAAGSKTFLEYFALPTPHWHRGGMDRIEVFAFDFPGGHFIRHLVRIFYRRRHPPGLKPFGGAQWWSMARVHAEYVADFVRSHPEYSRFHQWTLVPDELFFQTILLNAGDDIKRDLVCGHLRYVVWGKKGSYHPKLLTVEDFDSIAASGRLFARKFDAEVDAEVLDRVDAYVDNTRG